MFHFLQSLFAAKPAEARSLERAAWEQPDHYWPDLPEPPLLVRIVFIAAAISVLAAAYAMGDDDPTQPWQPILVTVGYVHDADTVSVTINLPFSVDLPGRSLRAFGYDAWETTKTRQTVHVTDTEVKKGLKARAEFMELLKTGTLYVESMTAIQAKPDPYGRMLTRWWLQVMSYPDGKPTATWIYIPKWMEQHGHLRTPRDPDAR